MDEIERTNIICQRSALTDGGLAARFQFEFDGRVVQAFAIAFDGELYAYANSCPHRGTELDWQHGERAREDPRPARRALPRRRAGA